MIKLASVIIPCYNAEKWLSEAIDSLLMQSYSAIEIIVIDDGSTDNSLNVIKGYGDKIVWETGSNRGGNHARNRGFQISKGEFIQFLDADDYLLPKKISRQIEALEEMDADAVYGDWRHQYHLPDGSSYLGGIKISGDQEDILASLLTDWWVSPACLLFRRAIVQESGGWDEQLKAGQDRDFFLSVVMQGAKVVYQSGCDSIYRRYGSITVSTSSKTRYLESHYSIVSRAEQRLRSANRLTPVYQQALAQSYFTLARKYLDIDFRKYTELLNKTLSLHPTFRASPKERTFIYNIAQNILGFRQLEQLVVFLKRLKTFLNQKKFLSNQTSKA